MVLVLMRAVVLQKTLGEVQAIVLQILLSVLVDSSLLIFYLVRFEIFQMRQV